VTSIIILFNIYVISLLILLLLDNREPTTTLSWFLIFLIFPVVGVILYLFFGRNWRTTIFKRKKLHKQLEKSIIKVLVPLINEQNKNIKKLGSVLASSNYTKLLRLLYNNSFSVLVTSNKLEILQNGEEKFPRLFEDLRNAKEFIHLEYYQLIYDNLTKELKKILIEKAKEGVEIRIIYDTWGCFWLKKKYIKELRNAGIQMYPHFNFLSPLKIHTLNYRLHRKLVVIDGKVGYVGGMNIGQEYIDGNKKFPGWRDTHMRLEGQSVLILEGIFAISWFNTTSERLVQNKYYPKVEKERNSTLMQITTSGPDSEWDSIKQLYFTLITTAQDKVYIQSPYFIPDQSMSEALKTAALSGVDVRIMVTGIPDKRVPYWAAFTYFKEVLQSGVKIYHYKKGFLHAKTVNIDSNVCSIGTANMDVRSFKLSYELNTLIYDKKISTQLEKDFMNDIKSCKEFKMKDYKKMPILAKLRNSILRLFAPLL